MWGSPVAFESTGLHPRTTVFGQHERMETAMARIIPRTNAKSPSTFLCTENNSRRTSKQHYLLQACDIMVLSQPTIPQALDVALGGALIV
jgi:hypothetical protein